MTEPDPEVAFAAIEIDAQFALDRPWLSAPPVAARPLVTIGIFPAFGAHRAWSVFDTPGPSVLVREIAWDRVSDLAAFAEPFPGRVLPRPTKPTLVLRDIHTPRATLAEFLASVESLPLPAETPPWSPTASEVSFVRLDARPGAPRFVWTWDLPPGWETLLTWFAEAIRTLEHVMTESR
ncbi:MAG: hypothetical protein AAB074_19620 [Planctomycetota bacterium]